MQNRIITISRQYGSGGRTIGVRLAERLNIPFYDKEMIALAATQSGISKAFFEEPEQGDFLLRDFSTGAAFEASLNDKIYLAQYAAIQSIAAKGSCVIVGRGASGVLKGTTPLLNVFIYGDANTRARRAVEEYGDSPHKIKERIDSIDKKRTSYFKFYTGMNAHQMENYHLCIDSSSIGIENAVTLIETAFLAADR